MEEDWRRKGATLSDKTARKEFGLTQDEIEAAIEAGPSIESVWFTGIHG